MLRFAAELIARVTRVRDRHPAAARRHGFWNEKPSTRLARAGDLTPDERLNALREFGADYGRHTERTHNLRQHVLTLNAGEPGPENVTSAPVATDGANAD